jgi:predicted nucleotidyltransferase
MGSIAYGVSSDASDVDIYGFCMPPKDIVFPHLSGYMSGFDREIPKFDQWQQHHIKEPDTGKQYDFAIYNIVKYFRLCLDNNPNMIDSLFTPRQCVLRATPIAEMVRERRTQFLHKGSWAKFKGYAYSQMHKMRIKEPEPGSKRFEMVEKYGYDLKFAYHTCRLLNEAEQIMVNGDIDLMQNREQLKSIRRGEWELREVEDFFNRKEKDLEKVYLESKLRAKPDEEGIKQLLLDCLEEYYGDLSKAVIQKDKASNTLAQIKKLLEVY